MVRNKGKKPQIRIVRNFFGTAVVSLVGIGPDLIILWQNTKRIVTSRMFFTHAHISPESRNNMILSLISFLACLLSVLFLLTVLFHSGLTMQKDKRIKALPFLIFAFFKSLYMFVNLNQIYYVVLLLKDILLYICISHTAKNAIVRKFFKPFKQIVEYQ